MVLTVTYCAALCINLFFGWPEEKSWNLGEWVNDNTIENTSGYVNAYVYSNEGYAHGHALAYTTTVAHEFNKSIFYERFKKIIEK